MFQIKHIQLKIQIDAGLPVFGTSVTRLSQRVKSRDSCLSRNLANHESTGLVKVFGKIFIELNVV